MLKHIVELCSTMSMYVSFLQWPRLTFCFYTFLHFIQGMHGHGHAKCLHFTCTLCDCLKSNTVLLQDSAKKSPAELIHHPLPPLLLPPGSAAARCCSACKHRCVKDCNQYSRDARRDGTDSCCRAGLQAGFVGLFTVHA